MYNIYATYPHDSLEILRRIRNKAFSSRALPLCLLSLPLSLIKAPFFTSPCLHFIISPYSISELPACGCLHSLEREKKHFDTPQTISRSIREIRGFVYSFWIQTQIESSLIPGDFFSYNLDVTPGVDRKTLMFWGSSLKFMVQGIFLSLPLFFVFLCVIFQFWNN